MIRVYLSSSFQDLQSLRTDLISLISKQKDQIFLVNMEDYSPERSYPADKCVADVKSCDIYIGIFAWRYGSIEPKSGKSITELELKAAEESGLEILGFVLDESAVWSAKDIDEDRANIRRLRQRVLDNYLGKVFTSREDLCQLVLSGLNVSVIRRLKLGNQSSRLTHRESTEVLQSYLRWLITCHERLEFRGINRARGGAVSVELRQVYLALQADSTNPLERVAARQTLLSELAAAIESGEIGSEAAETAEWYFIAGNPIMPSIESRDRLVALDPTQKELLNLAEAYFRESQLVVLGDPGSGKTTLARWLSLVLGQARLHGQPTVNVPLYQVDPNEEDEAKTVSLGLTRLPILIRIAEFAEARLRCNQEGTMPPTLLEFLGRNSWLGSHPIWGEDHPNCGQKIPAVTLNSLFQEALKANEALVVLDGLDEVPASALRDEIVEEVDAFAQQWIRRRQTISVAQADKKIMSVTVANVSAEMPGNRMIVTSRIAGYHAAPLQGDLAHVTVEPMSQSAVNRFIRNWMRAVHQEIARPGTALEGIYETADLETSQFLDALQQPRQRGGRELATNPLLCGILATVFRQRNGELPQERVELYAQAVEMLFDIWLRRERDDEQAQLLKHELYDILEPIALHIHRHEPTGLIAEYQLKQLAIEFLSASRGENFLKPSPKLRKAVDDMIRVVREDVGLLAARGDGVYGFLHLTFQEYLAARALVRDTTTAAARIAEHLGDARWREPIRLAFGYLNISQMQEFGRVVKQFLEQQSDMEDLLPQAALMVVGALPDLRQLEKPIVDLLTGHLLRSFSIRSLFTRLPRRRELIEWAFQQLLQHHTKVHFEERLIYHLESSRPTDPHFLPAIAALLIRLRHFTPNLFQALTKALPYDVDEWDWPINEATRFAVTPQRKSGEPFCMPKLGLLPMRDVLCQKPELLAVVKQDLDWLRAMIALYGGMGEYHASNVIASYHRMACFLQQEDTMRERYREAFSGEWGGNDGDFVYNMAVYLDTDGGPELKRAKETPEFRPDLCHRDSEWTSELVALLRKKSSPRDIIPQLRRFASSEQSTRKAQESRLLLWLLDENGEPGVRPNDDRLTLELRRVQLQLSDAASRIGSGAEVISALEAIQPRLSSTSWWALAEAAMTICLRHGSEPISLANLRGKVDGYLKPYLLSEMLVVSGKGWGDDAVYNSAVFADTVNCSPAEFLAAHTILPLACNNIWKVSHYNWPLTTIPPAKIPPNDIPPSILTNLQMIPPQLGFLRCWAFRDVLKPLIAENPDLLPEILACAQGDVGQRSSREDVFKAFNPGLLGDTQPAEKIAELIEDVNNPYHRVRALIRLSQFWPERRSQLISDAGQQIWKIHDPLEFEQCGEQLLSVLPLEQTHELWNRVCSAVLDITDPDEQARAWGRLGLLATPDKAVSLFKQAIQSAMRIEDEFARSTTLRLLRRAVGRDQYADGFAEALEQFVDPLLAARTNERWGDILNLLLPDLQSQKGHLELWAVLAVLGKAEQFAPRRRIVTNEILSDFPDATTGTACAAILDAATDGFVELTPVVAQAVERILMSGHHEVAERLFPRFVASSPEVAPFLKRQMHSPSAKVASIAALLLVELHGLSAHNISGLLTCLQSDSDICVNRAADQLYGTPQRPIFRASVLGADVLEELFGRRNRSDVAVGVGNAVTWFCERLLFDDPFIIERWAECLNREPENLVARYGLRAIHHCDPNVSEALKIQFCRGSLAVRNAIMVSYARMAKLNNVDVLSWEELRAEFPPEELDTLAQRNILAVDVDVLAKFIHDILAKADSTEPGEDIIGETQALLGERCGYSWADLFRVDGTAESLKKLKEIGETMFTSKGTEYARWAHSASVSRDAVAKQGFLELLTEWTRGSLAESIEDVGEINYLRSYLIELLAGAASVAPASFLRCHSKELLQPLLVRVVLEHRNFVGRCDAVRLLGYQRHLAEEMLPALRSALRDVEYVREAAIEAMGLFRRMDPNVLKEMQAWLTDPSSILAFGAALDCNRATRPNDWSARSFGNGAAPTDCADAR